MSDRLVKILEQQGPMVGRDLVAAAAIDTFEAWKYCAVSPLLITRRVGRRYLRLDAKVDGYARLSPSIMREFLNYTVVGLAAQGDAISKHAGCLEKEIASISREKISLARNTVRRLVESHPEGALIEQRTTFIIAGDVVFDMAHAEPRPESSTGELVRGSDLDIVVITETLPDDLIKELDALLYREKENLLMNPAAKEEIDYIIKDIGRVREQLRFDGFKAMVAVKILHEGIHLHGSRRLFCKLKKMLDQACIAGKIGALEKIAQTDRLIAEQRLAGAPLSGDRERLMALFYTTEEKEEIF